METGLVLLGHRYYDPGTGRFITRDPSGYGGGVNLYGYAGGNPVNRQDPDGTNWFTDQLNRFGRWFMGKGPKGLGQARGDEGLTEEEMESGGVSKLDANPQAAAQALQQGERQVAGIVAEGAAGAPVAEEEAEAEAAAQVLAQGTKFFKRYKNKGPQNPTTTTIGQFTRFSVETPNTVRGTFTRWVKTVNARGRTVQMYHDTVTNTGLLLHRGVKVPGPERHIPGIILRR